MSHPAPDASPGCAEFHVSRRSFLAGAAALAGGTVVSGLVGDVFTQTAYGAVGGNTLVVLSLRGGADGLSLVVPHGDPAYARARPHIAVPTGALLAKDAMFGLHPGLRPLLPLWNAGRFGAVHAVGLPTPNRSHFSAMEVVEDADPGSSARVGWLNRMVGQIAPHDPQQGMHLGSSTAPFSLLGPAAVTATPSIADLRLPGPAAVDWQKRMRASLTTLWGGNGGAATGAAARSTLTVTADLAALATDRAPANGANYPAGDLGKALAGAARVIRAGVGVQTVTLDYGGWDMHTNVGSVDDGAMQRQVAELGQALAAFFVDLGSASDRVTLATLTEFGRRVEENGGHGLDHGYGNVSLLLGAGVRGGQVRGRWPGLASGRLVDGDLAVTTDYRTVLSEVVASRFPAAKTSVVFPGFRPGTPVGIMG